MKRATNKAERLLQIEALLLAHSEGLTQAKIAQRLKVNRSTIYRYLPDLGRFSVYETDDGKLAIDRDHYLTNVHLTLHEAMALHLAARLMATRTDKHNPHAASALRKLGLALEQLAPMVSRHLQSSADVMDDVAQRHDPVYLEALETLTRAWSLGRKVWLKHQMADQRVFEYTFAPYFIEPYAVGRTAHVIGWRDPPRLVRTFKIERIKAIRILDETYTIPDDFDPREKLADAWGIWYTEAEPVEVVLRFHPRVAHRVRETQWHRSEQVEEQPDGSLLWRAWVAEPQEMLPWIRGWGADVEVMGPEELQEKLVKETKKMALLYGVGNVTPPPLYQRLWAKTNDDKTQTHPLICHLIDVAQVTLAMWNEVLTDSVRAQFAGMLGLDEEAAGRLIAFWAGLHDLGKASPAFQRKYAPGQIALEKAGLDFPKTYARESFYHGAASACLLPKLLKYGTELPRRWIRDIAHVVGGHHGAWPIPGEILKLKSFQLGGDAWDTVRSELVQTLTDVLNPPAAGRVSASREERNAWSTLLSGLVSVADWIGSIGTYFQFADLPVDVAQYANRAAQQAQDALDELRWTGWNPPVESRTFTELFALSGPRPMQARAIELAEQLDRPALVIIEAPTGVGKTEAALYLADHWARTLKQRGLYVAMPTMATSNQMFERVQEVMSRRYPEDLVEPLLIHSQARWSKDAPPPKVNISDQELRDTEQEVDSMAWFLPRKRSLLASFGVGTVDQTFLGVLQTRHFFVRLFGLSHKTLIFDEVHAYDTYMSTLFQRLLGWLRAVGASVVILSATLPEKTRRELLRAYARVPAKDVPDVSYPAITWAMEGAVGVAPVDAPERSPLALEWLDRDPDAIAKRLDAALRDGGYAAVICNTVGRAQEVYRALRDAAIVSNPDDDLILFHARFPFGWRREIEEKVRPRFGKNGERSGKAIVVATQVIEQSLDLDFDVMVSDLAPVDLLIQRAGRMHRHDRDERPAPLSAPRLIVTRPEMEDAAPNFGADGCIYEPYVLLRSYLTLRDRDGLRLPTDTSLLIESVYGDEEPDAGALAPALVEARREMRENQDKEIDKARRKLVKEPQADNLLRKSNAELAEDAPEVHRALSALTRSGPPSISIVCLHRIGESLNTEPDGAGRVVDLKQKPDSSLTQALVDASVSISHRGVFHHLLKQNVPPGWRNHALLRNFRVARFTNGSCALEGSDYTLTLIRRTGLEVVKST